MIEIDLDIDLIIPLTIKLALNITSMRSRNIRVNNTNKYKCSSTA